MKTLVTGADGFVASFLVPLLIQQGDAVVAGLRPGEVSPELQRRREALPGEVQFVELELSDLDSIEKACEGTFDRVVHLAALSSVSESRAHSGSTWEANVMGTVRLADAISRNRGDGVKFLFVSSCDVYGPGPGPDRLRTEDDPLSPVSPYAASKLAGEVAVLEMHRRTGMKVVVARAFPHSGPGQSTNFVVPAFIQRLALAKRLGAPVVEVGNLEPVRECMHVADVVDAYRLLLDTGVPGEIYNVASGVGIKLHDLFFKAAEIVGHRAIPETDTTLSRRVDIPHLVGDGAKLTSATGWTPTRTLDQTLREVLDAQEN